VEQASTTEYLRDQYETSDKLDIRIEAHRRYSEQPDDFVEWVLDRLDPRPGETVVDIGCGRGSYHPGLVRRGVRLILALDQSRGMVAMTQTQAQAQTLPVVAIEGRAEHIPVPDHSYDLGMANHVLFHVPDVSVALRELRRILKPGGRAVLATAAANSAERLESLHRAAAKQLGYHATGRVIERFNLEHLEIVRSIFPQTRRVVRDDAFLFPSAEVAVEYYASGMIDAIADRPVDSSHRPPLRALVGQQIASIVAHEGVFRDPKSAGCFIVRKA
jgi:ubiquinone/menaquinone biosynthesis C-methylase UbiE